MLLTPTFIGSLIAGVACWLLFWFGISHVDSIPYLNQYLSKKMILEWIRKNPQLALILTELVNVMLHGVGTAAAVMFRRKLRTMLEELGVNSNAHLDRAMNPVRTFADEEKWWKENVMILHKPSSRNSSKYILKKHLIPRFGAMPIDTIDSNAVQEWISDAVKNDVLAPKTIHNVYKVCD